MNRRELGMEKEEEDKLTIHKRLELIDCTNDERQAAGMKENLAMASRRLALAESFPYDETRP